MGVKNLLSILSNSWNSTTGLTLEEIIPEDLLSYSKKSKTLKVFFDFNGIIISCRESILRSHNVFLRKLIFNTIIQNNLRPNSNEQFQTQTQTQTQTKIQTQRQQNQQIPLESESTEEFLNRVKIAIVTQDIINATINKSTKYITNDFWEKNDNEITNFNEFIAKLPQMSLYDCLVFHKIQYNEEVLISLIIKRIIKILIHFLLLFSNFNVNEVYLSMDGTPPKSKMGEQRRRRYLASTKKIIKDNIAEIFATYNENPNVKGIYDNGYAYAAADLLLFGSSVKKNLAVSLSPDQFLNGSSFLKLLIASLNTSFRQSWIDSLLSVNLLELTNVPITNYSEWFIVKEKEIRAAKINFNPPDNPGEAEKKIINYIRSTFISDIEAHPVFITTDSDLILHALLLPLPSYVLRYSPEKLDFIDNEQSNQSLTQQQLTNPLLSDIEVEIELQKPYQIPLEQTTTQQGQTQQGQLQQGQTQQAIKTNESERKRSSLINIMKMKTNIVRDFYNSVISKTFGNPENQTEKQKKIIKDFDSYLFKKSQTNIIPNYWRIVNDIVFLMTILGNDYLPSLKTLAPEIYFDKIFFSYIDAFVNSNKQYFSIPSQSTTISGEYCPIKPITSTPETQTQTQSTHNEQIKTLIEEVMIIRDFGTDPDTNQLALMSNSIREVTISKVPDNPETIKNEYDRLAREDLLTRIPVKTINREFFIYLLQGLSSIENSVISSLNRFSELPENSAIKLGRVFPQGNEEALTMKIFTYIDELKKNKLTQLEKNQELLNFVRILHGVKDSEGFPEYFNRFSAAEIQAKLDELGISNQQFPLFFTLPKNKNSKELWNKLKYKGKSIWPSGNRAPPDFITNSYEQEVSQFMNLQDDYETMMNAKPYKWKEIRIGCPPLILSPKDSYRAQNFSRKSKVDEILNNKSRDPSINHKEVLTMIRTDALNAARSYIDGLFWLLSYYYDNPSVFSNWYYPSESAPLIEDIKTVIESTNNKILLQRRSFIEGSYFNLSKERILTPIENNVYVLPIDYLIDNFDKIIPSIGFWENELINLNISLRIDEKIANAIKNIKSRKLGKVKWSNITLKLTYGKEGNVILDPDHSTLEGWIPVNGVVCNTGNRYDFCGIPALHMPSEKDDKRFIELFRTEILKDTRKEKSTEEILNIPLLVSVEDLKKQVQEEIVKISGGCGSNSLFGGSNSLFGGSNNDNFLFGGNSNKCKIPLISKCEKLLSVIELYS